MLPDDLDDLAGQIDTEDNPDVRLGIGDHEIVSPPETLTIHGLGSCLGIFLYDPAAGVGVGIHTLLPHKSESGDEKDETRFTDKGIQTIYDELTAHTKVREPNIRAKIVGGSDVLRFTTMSSDVGKQNVTTAKDKLEDLNIPIDRQDVGGEYGRIVEFNPKTGGVIVRKANGDQKVI